MISLNSVVSVLIWMVLTMIMGTCRSCMDEERRGLLDLKAYLISFTNDSYFLREWQSSDSDCCRWTRVKCNLTSKHVTELSLHSFVFLPIYFDIPCLNLTMLYPFEELHTLNFSGTIYGGWFDPINGYKSLGRFRKLEILDLSYTSFNSSDWPFLDAAASLKNLILRGNFIEGDFPVKELENLRSLEVLDLKVNLFSGPLPTTKTRVNQSTKPQIFGSKCE